MVSLFCHNSTFNADVSCIVDASESQNLSVNFEIVFKDHSLVNTNKNFSKTTDRNFGLWNHDVFEVFLKSKFGNYLEFQISPLSQKFVLGVISPRSIEYSPLEIDWAGKSKLVNNIWTGTISISSQFLYSPFMGNIHAILGPKDQRSYYSLFGPKLSVPDFHRPEFFSELIV